jgi:hypothetical protein
LEPWVRALHGCNNTACVRVSSADETGLLHVVGGTQRDNMVMMARAGRGGDAPIPFGQNLHGGVHGGAAEAAGVLYRGTEFGEAVSEDDGAAAYFVDTQDGVVVETQLDTRRL